MTDLAPTAPTNGTPLNGTPTNGTPVNGSAPVAKPTLLGLIDSRTRKPRPEEWPDVQRAAIRIRNYFKVLRKWFVGRDELMRKIEYAFVMREHVLMFGPAGTAKTAIAMTILANIEGAVTWGTDFSRSMSETQVFGDFNVKLARATGQLVHRTEGSLLEAELANLGEILDANTPLLRALLRVLNEREFSRGSQFLKVPLMAAIANTNITPHAAMARDDTLSAVVDRFLFWEHVGYLQRPEDRLDMLRQQSGIVAKPAIPKLHVDDIKLVADAIDQTPLICIDGILQAYEELARRFAEKRRRPVSDRRLVRGVEMMKASAVLRERIEVDWDDLDSVSLILVDRTEDEADFQELLREIKEEGQDESARDMATTEIALVDRILSTAPTDDLDMLDDGQLVTYAREMRKAHADLQAYTPTSVNAKEHRRRSLQELKAKIDAARRKIEG